jgi:hypothetical protein
MLFKVLLKKTAVRKENRMLRLSTAYIGAISKLLVATLPKEKILKIGKINSIHSGWYPLVKFTPSKVESSPKLIFLAILK